MTEVAVTVPGFVAALSADEANRLRSLCQVCGEPFEHRDPADRQCDACLSAAVRRDQQVTAALEDPPRITNDDWTHQLVSDAFGIEPAFDWNEVGRESQARYHAPPKARPPVVRHLSAERGVSERYGLVALEREAATVAEAPVGLRHQTLRSSAWSLARLVCDGRLETSDVETGLVEAACAAGLTAREASSAVRSALRKRAAT